MVCGGYRKIRIIDGLRVSGECGGDGDGLWARRGGIIGVG